MRNVTPDNEPINGLYLYQVEEKDITFSTNKNYKVGDILLGSPPRTRGIRDCVPQRAGYAGITPAHAGNTDDFPGYHWSGRDHPRARGEYVS